MLYLDEGEGIFPLVYVKSFIFKNRLISLPFADYGGLCTNDERIAEKLISKAEDIAKELDVDFIEIRSQGKDYFKLFEKHGFVRRDDYFTFVLNIDKKVDRLWEVIGKKNRNMIRKAGKNGVKIEEAANKSDLKMFYGLYSKTMKKLGSPPQPYKFFEMIWDIFYPKNLKIIFAMCNGKCIASGLYFLYGNIIHHAYSCSSKEYLGLGPNNLMQWFIIKWGNKHRYRYLDFGRTRENEGTVLFKKRWGGERIEMPYFYKFYKKELKERQEIQYRWISSLWSKYMPEFAVKWIGPWIIKQIG